MFLRKPSIKRDPLAVTMSGVRMGERVLQIGADDARLAGAIAAKVGLSGHAAMVVASDDAAARARSGIAEAGVLVDLHVGTLESLPFEAGSFDAVVVHNMKHGLGALADQARDASVAACRRVLRAGGRIIVIEPGERSGVGAWLRPSPQAPAGYVERGGTVAVLDAGGFKPVRILGDREGLRFIEGLKT